MSKYLTYKNEQGQEKIVNKNMLISDNIKINSNQETKTGRKINGKDEYVLFYQFTGLNDSGEYYKTVPFKTNDVYVLSLFGVQYSGNNLATNGNYFPLSDRGNTDTASASVRLDYSSNQLKLLTTNGNIHGAFVEIKYIYK